MQYRFILSALAIAAIPLMEEGLNTLCAEETRRDIIFANKFDGKGTEAIRDAMPPQEKLDEAARLMIEESYGKLPMSFIRNDGQLNKQVQYYERGAGHATYFTKQGVYLSLVGGRTSVPLVSEQLAVDSSQTNEASRLDQNVSVQAASLNQHGMGYGPRITENGIQSNPKVLDVFLISSSEPLSQIQDQQTSNNTRTNKFVHATLVNDLKPETCGERSRTTHNPQSEIVRLMPLCIEKDVEIVAGKEQTGKVNYLIGNDPEKWKTNIPMYESVVYKGVYDGIDMKFYGNNRQMEYDIIVKPGASPSRVQLSYEGIEGLTVAENGDLEISLKEGKLIQKKPYVYQEIDGKRVEIEGTFRILSSRLEVRNPKSTGIYGFTVASYDKRYPLVIDPCLTYSTYLGGSTGFDYGFDIAVDAAGHTYVTGTTQSPDFPTVSPYDDTENGYSDVFVTKLNAQGNALFYSSYLGGSGLDQGYSIAIDSAGNAYVTGFTSSPDFPTASPYDGNLNDEYGDAFVTKLDATGSNLVYSTYWGESGFDKGYGIAVDSAGNAYVTGFTESSDTNEDAFVIKLDASGSGLVYFTRLTGNLLGDGFDRGEDIALDSAGNVYVTGDTSSTYFFGLRSVSGYDQTHNGSNDAFIVKLNTSFTVEYWTYLGGTFSDFGKGIAVDAAGNAYVSGHTLSPDFPDVPPHGNSGSYDAFVSKLDASGNNLIYSIFLGGFAEDRGEGIAVDGEGNAYVTGYASSPDFPMVAPYDGWKAGMYDAFISKLDGSGSLVYSTYLGGSNSEFGKSIALDSVGNAYVTGHTTSPDFPTALPYDCCYNGGSDDAFVCKFNFGTPEPNTCAPFIFKFDIPGGFYSQFGTPYGVTVDSAGRIIVADAMNSCIQVFDASGNFLNQFGTFGSEDGQFMGPHDVAVNSAGNILVVDQGNHRIQVFDASGNFLSKFGTEGIDDGQFLFPEGITLDSAGRIIVADPGNYRIQVFDASGNFLHKFGSQGNGDGQFEMFHDVTVDSAGRIIVPDSGNQRIQIFDASGNFLSKFGTLGFGDGQLSYPVGVTVDSANNIIVVEKFNHRVQIFDQSGNYLCKFGHQCSDDGNFLEPNDVALDLAGNIVVADQGNNRIQVFGSLIPQPTPTPELTPTPTPEPTPTPTPTPTPEPSNLQAHYALNEMGGSTAGDSSGNGNDGTISGATWTNGKSWGGLNFDGVNDYVTTPLINNNEVSVSAWFYKYANDTTRNDAIFSGFRSNSDMQLREGFELRFLARVPNTLEFILVTQDGGGIRTARTIRRNLVNSIGGWYHAVGTYNQTTGQQKLYINGESVNSVTHPAGNTVVPLTFYPDMRIGHSRVNNGYFNGVIDDVRLYNQPLSDQEIRALYTTFTADLQAHYTLDEGSGTIANDSSGNGNHGAVNGGAIWMAGINGNGLGFDGVDDYVIIPRINHDEISVTAWFYKNANDTARNDAVFGGFRNNSNAQLREGFELRFPSNSPETLQFVLVTQDGGGVKTMRTAQWNLANSVGSWYHVAGTYNKTTGEQRLYVNGAQVNTQTHPAGNTVVPLTAYTDMRIGYSRVNAGYFNGVIDNVRLYKLELTALDVLSLYNNEL